MRRNAFVIFLWSILLTLSSSCNSVDDNRLPNMSVYIDLSTPDKWDTYGVPGFGSYRMFIRQLGEPRNFPYTGVMTTGYGGVLLVCGFNPFTLETPVPMAYDLACPVERDAKVRVNIQNDGLLPYAVCPKCGSRFDICERGGVATEGEALRDRASLKRYECYPTNYNGYIITN